MTTQPTETRTEQTETEAAEVDLSEHLNLEVGEGALTASVSMREGSYANDLDLTVQRLTDFLMQTHGLSEVNESMVETLVRNATETGEFFENIMVADHGREPVHGRDGYLDWLTDGDEQTETEIDDAEVDYFKMYDFRAVEEDTEFARLTKPTPGQDGVDVRGNVLKARPGKELELRIGDNDRLALDSGLYRSEIAGRVEISKGAITVSRVLDVEQHVDYSTGNIDFAGIVNVPGDVKENFELRAEDGICVRGLVEAATVNCGGTINMVGGLNGRDRGSIEARGEVVAKFITNGDVMARGDVHVSKEIVSSRVHGRNVLVPAGAVAGGEVTAIEKIVAAEAGNPNAIKTVLAVNVDMFAIREAERVKARLDALHEALTAISENLKPVRALDYRLDDLARFKLERLEEHAARLEQEQGALQEKHAELTKAKERRDGIIELKRGVYPGVVLRIGRYEKAINQRLKGKRTARFDDEKYDIVVE